jgi:archaellum component FlaC
MEVAMAGSITEEQGDQIIELLTGIDNKLYSIKRTLESLDKTADSVQSELSCIEGNTRG